MNELSSSKEAHIKDIQMQYASAQIKKDKIARNTLIAVAAAFAGWGALSFDNGPLAEKITQDDKADIYKNAITQVISAEVADKTNGLTEDFQAQVEAYINGGLNSDAASKTLTLNFEDVVNKIDEQATQMIKEKEDNINGRAMGALLVAFILSVGIFNKHMDAKNKQSAFNQRYPANTPNP